MGSISVHSDLPALLSHGEGNPCCILPCTTPPAILEAVPWAPGYPAVSSPCPGRKPPAQPTVAPCVCKSLPGPCRRNLLSQDQLPTLREGVQGTEPPLCPKHSQWSLLQSCDPGSPSPQHRAHPGTAPPFPDIQSELPYEPGRGGSSVEKSARPHSHPTGPEPGSVLPAVGGTHIAPQETWL